MTLLGVFSAIGALIAWTFGDFSIQRAVRKIGNVYALFLIGITGSVVLFPFVFDQLPRFFSDPHYVIFLSIVSLVICCGAFFEFEALKEGKLAIVEPILGFELPITIVLAIIFLHERPTSLQCMLMVTTFIGIIFAVTIAPSKFHIDKNKFENGFVFACIGAVCMGGVNFLVGKGSESIGPLMTIWFTNTAVSVITFFIILKQRRVLALIQKVKTFPKETMLMVVLDNMAWIFFALATSLISVSLATTISESYIVFAVLLGVYVNHEKIRAHQKLGIAIAIGSIVLLAFFTL